MLLVNVTSLLDTKAVSLRAVNASFQVNDVHIDPFKVVAPVH